MSINAYRKTIAKTENPRQIERRLLSEVTAQLREHIEYDILTEAEQKLSAHASGLRDILWKNERIWQALKSDLMDPENALDSRLRSSLISLSLWVERHTAAVLAGKQKLAPLIDVNTRIIRGLSGDTREFKE